jgi:hypothetical protein
MSTRSQLTKDLNGKRKKSKFPRKYQCLQYPERGVSILVINIFCNLCLYAGGLHDARDVMPQELRPVCLHCSKQTANRVKSTQKFSLHFFLFLNTTFELVDLMTSSRLIIQIGLLNRPNVNAQLWIDWCMDIF